MKFSDVLWQWILKSIVYAGVLIGCLVMNEFEVRDRTQVASLCDAYWDCEHQRPQPYGHPAGFYVLHVLEQAQGGERVGHGLAG